MHLYLMRHGETFWNKKGLIQGDIRTDFPDSSYQTFSAASGKPYKALRTFSSSDELTAIDWYYKCTLEYLEIRR